MAEEDHSGLVGSDQERADEELEVREPLRVAIAYVSGLLPVRAIDGKIVKL